jgi:hypothetical protein
MTEANYLENAVQVNNESVYHNWQIKEESINYNPLKINYELPEGVSSDYFLP